jgi:hypothetical protein
MFTQLSRGLPQKWEMHYCVSCPPGYYPGFYSQIMAVRYDCNVCIIICDIELLTETQGLQGSC